jgi:hypothetical protein
MVQRIFNKPRPSAKSKSTPHAGWQCYEILDGNLQVIALGYRPPQGKRMWAQYRRTSALSPWEAKNRN